MNLLILLLALAVGVGLTVWLVLAGVPTARVIAILARWAGSPNCW